MSTNLQDEPGRAAAGAPGAAATPATFEDAGPGPANSPRRDWYVFLSKPRQEAYASSKLLEQGYEVFVPTLRSWQRNAAGWTNKDMAMFPRYGFVRPQLPSQAIGRVRSTPGISTLVSFGHVLACMPADRLDALRALVAAHAAALPQQPFSAGSAVVFCAGPLKGATGIVSTVAAERVQVLMTLLGQQQKILVPKRDLALA